jgi:hypothetical protein
MDSQRIIICLFIVTAAIIDGRYNMDRQGIIICLLIVTRAIIDDRFSMDSQGIIICLFIVTRAIIDDRFNMDSKELIKYITISWLIFNRGFKFKLTRSGNKITPYFCRNKCFSTLAFLIM